MYSEPDTQASDMGAAGLYMWASRGMSWWQRQAPCLSCLSCLCRADTSHTGAVYYHRSSDRLWASTAFVVRILPCNVVAFFGPLGKFGRDLEETTVTQINSEAQTTTDTMSQAQNVAIEDQGLPEVHRRYFPSGEWCAFKRDKQSLENQQLLLTVVSLQRAIRTPCTG